VSGVTNGRKRVQLPPGAAGEGRKTASPKYSMTFTNSIDGTDRQTDGRTPDRYIDLELPGDHI